MKRFLLVLIAISFGVFLNQAQAQCNRSGAFFGEMVPNAGCGTFRNYSPYGPGEYFRMPVLQGGSYTISTCGGPNIDTQITAYQGNNSVAGTHYAYNDDNGPICSGFRASLNIAPNFSDYTRVQVSQFNCQSGGSSSITVSVRQNNNLSITSSSAAMCAGQTRSLTATPSRVTGSIQSNSGNRGTFSGTGVSGTTFTAPTPAGASATYTITYTFGYCSTTQNILVYRNPTTANAGANQVICSNTTSLAANTPTVGTGAWSLVSGTASIANSANPNSPVTLTSNSATFRWTITNGNCTASTDDVTITRDNVNPVITCPSNFTVSATSGQCQKVVGPSDGYSVTATDNCGSVTPTLVSGFGVNGALPVGTHTESWTVSDALGNSASCSFTITVEDNEAPVATCPANITVSNDPGTCDANVSYSGSASDNCPGVALTTFSGPSSGSAFTVGTTTVTLRATDAGGLTNDCSFTVTVNDTESPTISCPADISVSNDAGQCGANVSWAAVTGSDNCPGSVTAQTAGGSSGSFFAAESTTTVSYTITDATGNTNSCSFNVTVDDNENPVITCPADIVVSNDQGQCNAVVTFADATATDNCPGVIVSQTDGLVSTSQFGVTSSPNTVEFTAEDAAGNTATCTFTVTVNDTENPTITCPTDIVVDTDPGVCDAVVSWTEPVGSDNCPGQSTVRTVGPAPGVTLNSQTVTTVTYEVTDAYSNTADCSFTITVEDNEVPVVTCPADQNVTFPGCQYTLLDYVGNGLATASDNCTPLTVVQTPAASTVITEETTVQVSATDPSGNETVCAFTISPLDNSIPTFDNCPTSAVQVSVNASCQFFMPDYSTLSVSDDCNPTFTFTQSPAAGTPATTTTSVTVTVSDGTNTADCTFDVEPLDDTDPTIVCQGNQTVSPNIDCEYDLIDFTGLATASDNCDNSVDITQSPAIGTTVSANTTITLTATDDNSNTATCTFDVILEDDTAPVITCPIDQDEDYNALCQFTVVDYTGMGSATDNCDNAPVITQSPSAGTSIGSTTAVTLTATDASGNSSTCSFNVIPDDNTGPNISCPTTQLLDVDANCEGSTPDYTGLATTSDNCDASPTVTQSPSVGTTVIGAGTSFTVTLTSTDASSNASSCTFTVTTQDVTAPTITCAGDLNVNFDAGCQFTVGNYVGTPTVSDNCTASPVVTQSPTLGTVISGQTTVTLTATDGAGLQSTCTFDIIPDDNEVPSISCPSNIPVDFDANCQFTLADYTGLGTASDNCDQSVSVTQSPAFGTVVSASTVITLTATDDASNSNTCTFSVVPSDNTDPTVTCPSDQNEDFSASCQFDLPDYTSLVTADDNCDNSLTVTQSPVATTTISGSQVVTITVTDDNSNSASCTFNVIPDDNTDPTITCPGDDNVSFNAQCTHNLGDYTGDATAGDNCDTDVAVTQSPVSGTSIGTTTTVTLTATDDAGNTATCSFDVIPADDEDPTISCPGNQTVSVDGSCEYDLLDYTGLATSGDNCTANPTVTQDVASGTTVTSNTTITLTATDGASNTATCSFDVVLEDNAAPSVTCPSDQNVSFDAGCQFTLVDYTGSATTSDNCDVSPTLSQSPAASSVITGSTVITITSQDASGNTSTCTFSVIPDDSTDPTITCPGNQIVSSNASCQFTIIDYTSSASALDNCDLSVSVTQSPAFGTIITVPTTVTLTAEDDNTNTATCSFLVTPADNDNPNITCPGDQLEDFDADCEFDVIDYTGLASASDNCSGAPTVTQDVSVGTTIFGTTTITLTATDDDSNTATCTFDVVPDDNTAPTVTCPTDQNVDFGANCQFSLPDYTGSATTSDNCTTTPTVTQSPVAGSVIGSTTVVTVSSTDANGNVGTCTFNVIPADNTAPSIACPSDVSEVFDANCAFELPDYTNQASVSDNCDAAPFTVSQSPVATTSVTGATVITLSVTDVASNTATCTFNVLPIDNEDPTIACPTDQSVSVDASCQFSLADYTGSVTADDNCDTGLDLVQSPASGSTLSLNTVVTVTATDDAGNSASCTFNVNPVDDTAPSLTCPGNLTVNADEDCQFTMPDVTAGATVNDNCDATPFVTQSLPIGSPASGTTNITLTATDASGNSSTCSFDITVNDTEPPTVDCPADQVEALSASCDFTVSDYSALVSTDDNCDSSVDLVQSPAAGSTVSSNTTVTFTATDDDSNIGTCSFQLILEDQTDPTISCPVDQTVALGANCQFIVANYIGLTTSSDNCDPSLSVTQSPLAGSLIGGSTVVTVSAEDASGNVGTCSFNVIPEDVDAPTIFDCPTDITVDNDEAICGAVVTYPTITSLDNCAGIVVPTLDQGQLSGTVFDVGTTQVVWIADDGNGNTTNCEFEVTVNDTEDPIIICPGDITVNVDPSTCGATVTYTLPTVTDNCTTPIVPTLDGGMASGSTFPEGTSTVTYGAEDQYGNTSSCSFTITVNDNEDPVITCPADVVVGNDPGLCEAVATYALPTVTDNCTNGIVPGLVSGLASGSSFPFGSTTVMYQAVDGSGNTDDCSFTVTVNDVEDPVVTCPNDTLIDCDAVVAYDDATATDNCAATVTITELPNNGFVLGPNTVEFEGDDGNGNTATCSFTVTIQDTVAPMIDVCPSDQLEAFDPSCLLAIPDYTALASASDNCDGAPSITQSPVGGAIISGTTTVTITAEDVSGNQTTCTFTVTDNTPPVVTCPDDQTVGSDINCQYELLDYTALAVSTDNCGATSMVQSPAVGTLISVQTTITVTATDDFGNTSTCDFDVIPFDNIAPSITCIGNQSALFDANCEFELPDYTGQAITDDNCDLDVDVTQSPAAGTLISGASTVTFTATDDAGTSTSCTFTVSPIDNIAPTIACPTSQVAQFDASCSYQLDDYTGLATTGDNCSSLITVSQVPAVGSVQTLNTIVTLTAEDENGNTASCLFIVVPEDNVNPTIACPADLPVDFDANCMYALVDYTALGTPADNCSSTFTVSQAPAVGTMVSGDTEITLTVDDGNGNTGTCTFNVIPEDNLAPTITCGDDQDVVFDENCQFEIGDYIGLAVTADNCASNITVSQSPVAGTFVSGASTITLTAEDENGNTATCNFDVIPEDLTAPSIVCPADLEVSLNASCAYILTDYTGLATADDDCSVDVLVTQDVLIGAVIDEPTFVTLTATDDNGNTDDCSFAVIPADDTDPTVVCPSDLEVDLDNNCQFLLQNYVGQATASDNCSFVLSQLPDEGTVITSQTAVTITVTDGAGNTDDCTFQVIPADNEPPVLTCPSDVFVDLDENCQYELPDYLGSTVYSDNCSSAIPSQFPPAGTVVIAETEVTMTLEDDNGNEVECSFTVITEDDIDPVATQCPENVSIQLNSSCEYVMPDFTSQMLATDNCDSDLDYQQSPAPGYVIDQATTFDVQVGAFDDEGNFALCEFSIETIDDSDPTIECPADQILALTASCAFIVPDYTTLAVTDDACGGDVTVTQSPIAGSVITSQLNATLIAEDEDGNTATCTFFVDVIDYEMDVTGTDASCEGGNDGTATVTISGGEAPYTEDWGGFNPLALAPGTYAVTVTDANGCVITDEITIGDGPTFELEIDPSGEVVICEGTSLAIDAGDGFADYDWSTGASVQTINVSNEGDYWVTVTSAEGCVADDTVSVSFYTVVVPTINPDADGVLYCSNDTALSYQWYLNGDPITDATSNYYCPLQSGNYYVVIVDHNGCELTSPIEEHTFVDDSPCATNIDEFGLSLDVYPNPSSGIYTISYSLDHQAELQLSVIDLVGRQVTSEVQLNALTGTRTIDLSAEADGVYLLRIVKDGEHMMQERLILVK